MFPTILIVGRKGTKYCHRTSLDNYLLKSTFERTFLNVGDALMQSNCIDATLHKKLRGFITVAISLGGMVNLFLPSVMTCTESSYMICFTFLGFFPSTNSSKMVARDVLLLGRRVYLIFRPPVSI